MDYCVSIGQRQYRINVQNNRMMIDGQPVQGNLIPLNTNGLHLLRRGQRDVEVHLREQDPGTVEVVLGNQRVIARLENPRRRSRRADNTQAGALTAPMPGLVAGVAVCEGQQVERGQVVAVLESMKMQMQMRAPVGGRVSKVAVQKGSQVEKGSLLVQID